MNLRQKSIFLWKVTLFALILGAVPFLSAREKDATQYGMGLIVNIPYPSSEVEQVVQEVVQNGIIRGTKEYNKDEYISGATAESSSRVFPTWTEGGKIFYKVRLKALDPRNFKNSGDVGTLAVRYIVQPQGPKNTVLKIDALFVEDFKHAVHPSNGSVESAEYKDIHDRLDSIEVVKTQTVEAETEKRSREMESHETSLRDESNAASASAASSEANPTGTTAVENTTPEPKAPPQTLEERVHDLRRQVQRIVKSPGAPLKSAPFHTASTLLTLPTGTEVLIVVTTPYWLGVETHDGQHGWMLRDELELLP